MDKVSQITNFYNKITQTINITRQIFGLEPLKLTEQSDFPGSSFVIRHSSIVIPRHSLIRHSSFVIRHSIQPYPRIDKSVKNIEGQIDEYVNQPEKETNAH